jgi:hypothetical protein
MNKIIINGIDYVVSQPMYISDNGRSYQAVGYRSGNVDDTVTIAWDIIPIDDPEQSAIDAVGYDNARYLYDSQQVGDAYIISR